MSKAMKYIVSLSFVAFLASLSIAQTFDTQPPSREDVCDGLTGATYGICNAYCEAQDCDARPNKPGCRQLRAKYAKLTGSEVFPCDPRCGDGIVQEGEECDGGDCDTGPCNDDCTCPEAPECPCGERCENDDGTSGVCADTDGDEVCECTSNPNPECAGQTCATFTVCNPGSPNCGDNGVCVSTAEGGGSCLDGSTPCAGLADCTTTADCAGGGLCAVNTCCGRPVCVPDSQRCLP